MFRKRVRKLTEKISGMAIRILWVDLKTYEQKIQYLVAFHERHKDCPNGE